MQPLPTPHADAHGHIHPHVYGHAHVYAQCHTHTDLAAHATQLDRLLENGALALSVRIAIITDIHYDPEAEPHGDRAKDIADILLLRAVHHVNRFIKPDIVLVLGDVLDDGNKPLAAEWRAELKAHLDLLEAPCVTIPGNHDRDAAPFFRDFGTPPDFLDVAGVRFVPFVDPEEPGYCARRDARDIGRLAEARSGYDGPLVTLQHVPIFPPGEVDCRYNYTNAPEVWESMRKAGVLLAICGHYHEGFEMIRDDGPSSIAVETLCEFPYPIIEIEIDGDRIGTTRHELGVPRELGLIDRHVHTQMAYCNENMDFKRVFDLAPRLGLGGVGLAEHADQLYYSRDLFRVMDYIRHGMDAVPPDARRVDEYLECAREAGYPAQRVGFEVDADYHGNLVIDPADLGRAGFIMGAIHDLPELLDGERDAEPAADEFLAILEKFAATGIDILAHPFRVFRRGGVATPERLFEPTVEILRRHHIAAEINFHTNDPSPEFVAMCIERGVSLVLGTDSHNLYEVGYFAPHLALLREIGAENRLDEILWHNARAVALP